MNESKPWVTFCMTTYKRPEFLKKQLTCLSNQTFTNFHVVISDNDPEASAEGIVRAFNDNRFLYYHNERNLGMILSFNRAIEKAATPYIVMLTDDDHVDKNMLKNLKVLSIYIPVIPLILVVRDKNIPGKQVEIFDKENYVFELLRSR